MTRDQARILLERHARAWERADLGSILGHFAPDGELIWPTERCKGHLEIARAYEQYFSIWGDVQIVLSDLVIDGDEGAVEWAWTDTDRRTGQRSTIDAGGFFRLRDRKIVRWREYWQR